MHIIISMLVKHISDEYCVARCNKTIFMHPGSYVDLMLRWYCDAGWFGNDTAAILQLSWIQDPGLPQDIQYCRRIAAGSPCCLGALRIKKLCYTNVGFAKQSCIFCHRIVFGFFPQIRQSYPPSKMTTMHFLYLGSLKRMQNLVRGRSKLRFQGYRHFGFSPM